LFFGLCGIGTACQAPGDIDVRGRVAYLAAVLISAAFGAQAPPATKGPEGSVETKIKGKLIDARCHTEPKCRVAADTKEYGMIIPDGTFLVFDEGGNQKVQRFLEESPRGRKLLQAKPGKAKRIMVIASGTRTGNTYNLESIAMAK
jgi:hypothetical protein